MDLARELKEALAVAELAGEFIRAEYDAFVPIPDAPASISTKADTGAQDIILKHLLAAFPGDGFCAEESTAIRSAATDAKRVWVIDPIDGTRGFAMKNGEFSVMIGLTIDRVPVLGVVYEPIQRRMTYACQGMGCYVMQGDSAPVRCRVSACAALESAVMTTSHMNPNKPPKPVIRKLQPGTIHQTYSAGVKLALVARGEVDLYVNDYPEFHDWDICAGHVLVEQAGGTVTEFDGGVVQYGRAGAKRRGGMVATNGALHAEVLNRLGGVIS
jgi:3'(2'), 5'-bisphosphate nucleotidase